MAGRLTRRAMLAATALAACGRRRAPRYSGWLFIASGGERGIAVGDLAEFRRVTTIALPQIPQQILRAGAKVFATCPDAHLICEIDPARFTVAGRTGLSGRIVCCGVATNGAVLVVATDGPAALQIIDVASDAASRRIAKTIALPHPPIAMDISDDMAAVSTAGDSVVRVSLTSGRILGSTELGLLGGIVRFGQKGKSILAGAADQNQIVSLDAATGALLARLPLAFVPTHFCFSADGGQMSLREPATIPLSLLARTRVR